MSFLQVPLCDLYAYEAIMGMGSSAPAVRAAGVAIVAAIAEAAPGLAAGLLPRLQELQLDSWWQVRAGLVQVCTGWLRGLDGSPDAQSPAGQEAVQGGLDLLRSIIAKETSHAVLRIFVANSTSLLQTHGADMAVPYVRHIAALPADSRESLLGVTHAGAFVQPRLDRLPLAGPSALRYELKPIGRELPYSSILPALASDAAARRLQNLDNGHFQLILSCMATAVGESTAETAAPLPPEFNVVSGQLREYVFVGLCDPSCCLAAASLLRQLLLRGPPQEVLGILGSPTLQVSLQLIHQPSSGVADRGLQESMAELLLQVAQRNKPAGVSRTIAELLRVWAQRYPGLYATSPLQKVSEKVAR